MVMVRKVPIRKRSYLIAILLCTAGLAACGRIPSPGEDTALFIPPTPVGIPTLLPVITAVAKAPTIVATLDENCSNLLAYIQDLTIPDGSIFAPGEKVDKRWLVENQGTCNWNNRYTLRISGGEPMGAKTEQSLIPALAGSQATIRVQFTAPSEGGKYRSAWQAYSPDGKPFGDPIFVEIEVIPRVIPSPVS
jgi:hypothetical protein